MAGERWERYAAATGVLAAVLVGIGYFVVPRPPAVSESVSTISAYVTANASGIELQSVLVTLGGAALLWFVGSLRSALRQIEGGAGRLSAVAFGGGVTAIALGWVSGAFLLVGTRLSGGEAPAFLFGSLIFHFAGYPAAILLGAAGLVILRSRGLPPWLGWTAGAVSVLIFLHVVSAPFLDSGVLAIQDVAGQILLGLFFLWIVLASVVLWDRAAPAPARARTARKTTARRATTRKPSARSRSRTRR